MDAQRALDIGHDEIARLVGEWRDSPSLKKEYAFFQDYLQTIYPLQ